MNARAEIDAALDVRRVLIVANPAARGYAPDKLAAIGAALARENIAVDIERSAAKGDIASIVEARARDFDVVAVHGGDGTINEAVAGLRAMEGDRPALALIAGGTANVLAHETGASFDPADVARAIAAGRTQPLHYGLANGRPFVLMASAGLDAAVVHRTPARLKSVIGKWAYVLAALAMKRRGRTPDLTVTAAGETFRCRLAICANSSRYGGDFVVAPDTAATRPGLGLVLLTDDSLAALARIGWQLVRGKGLESAGVRALAVEDATIAAETPTPAQIDGDPAGQTPLRIVAAATPLRVVVEG